MPREVKYLAFIGVEKPTMASCGGSRAEYKRQGHLWRQANMPGHRKRTTEYSHQYKKRRTQRDPEYKTFLYGYFRDYSSALGYRRDKSGRKRMDNVPDWLTEEHLRQMRAVYRHARLLSKETGVEHHVDHVYPVMGKNEAGEHISCGLHVPWNLQILTATENRAKGRQNPVEDK